MKCGKKGSGYRKKVKKGFRLKDQVMRVTQSMGGVSDMTGEIRRYISENKEKTEKMILMLEAQQLQQAMGGESKVSPL